MLQKKVCMLGSFAVGKTSLVTRFVKSLYSDTYHTTIGVKIDKKLVEVDQQHVNCILWDIAGEDEFYTINNSYLRGMSGYILVVDNTRKVTLDVAKTIYDRVEENQGKIPCVLVINKTDLNVDSEISEQDLEQFIPDIPIIKSSAKTGQGVEEAFTQLVHLMLNKGHA